MESTWDKPQELADWEAKIAALQTPATETEPETSKVNGTVSTETNADAKSDSEEEEEDQVGVLGE